MLRNSVFRVAVVPIAVLLLSLVGLALILYLQENEASPTSDDGDVTKEVSNPGGTMFVEDEEGHTVRRSKRCCCVLSKQKQIS